jgi:hypothetical protein
MLPLDNSTKHFLPQRLAKLPEILSSRREKEKNAEDALWASASQAPSPGYHIGGNRMNDKNSTIYLFDLKRVIVIDWVFLQPCWAPHTLCPAGGHPLTGLSTSQGILFLSFPWLPSSRFPSASKASSGREEAEFGDIHIFIPTHVGTITKKDQYTALKAFTESLVRPDEADTSVARQKLTGQETVEKIMRKVKKRLEDIEAEDPSNGQKISFKRIKGEFHDHWTMLKKYYYLTLLINSNLNHQIGPAGAQPRIVMTP